MESQPNSFEEKKRADDVLDREQILEVNNDWRRKIHYRSKNYESFKNVVFVGGKDTGKYCSIQSTFRSLYPALEETREKTPRAPVCFRLTEKIYMWKFRAMETSEDVVRQWEDPNLPKFDLMVFTLTIMEREEAYFTALEELVALCDLKRIPFVFWVTKVDLLGPKELAPRFDELWRKLSEKRAFPKDILMPVKNAANRPSSALLDYFVLRVLDKSLDTMPSI